METKLIITNVHIFNGKDEVTIKGNILINNNLIEKISITPIPVDQSDNVKIIDGQGKFLMPGLIDAHWHSYMCCNTMIDLISADVAYTQLKAGKEAEATLLRGFTSIRDAGGPVFGLKRAIDEQLIAGPRIYPSGALITQTAGHGDFRMPYENTHPSCSCGLTHVEAIGASIIADGVDAVTVATRNNLRQGATQIKLMTGGGVASLYDPLDATEYFEEEIHAAVKAADDWGTYVMVHVYNPKGIARAIKAGVKSIEHGHLMDEPTMELIAEKKIWLSMQAFAFTDNTYPTEMQQAKNRQVCNGTDNVYKLAKKYKAKLAWGTDLLFNPNTTKNQNSGILKLKQWFSNFEILRMVTHDNAQLLGLSNLRNPYPGKLGVIEEGALADMILVDGDVLNNVDLLGDPKNNFQLIMKNGVIYKNTLQ